MRYEQAMSKYWKKKLSDPYPPLQDDERIYLNVDYMNRYFAKACRCGFDRDRKLWFTGSKNKNLPYLIRIYGINPATSQKALDLMDAEFECRGYTEEKRAALKQIEPQPRAQTQRDKRDPQSQKPKKDCPECGSLSVIKNGKTAAGAQRFRCKQCGKSYIETS